MPRVPATIVLAVAACSLRPYDFDALDGGTDPTGSTGPAATGGPAATTTSSTSATGTTAAVADTTGPDPGSTSSPFIVENDGGVGVAECDILAQDCPEGQKCMPYSGDGDNSWESLGCFPVVPDPAGLYQPCEVIESGVSGKDTCDVALMCWNVDDETGQGVCFGLCMGESWENPTCADPNAYCMGNRSALSLCIPNCDPIVQDCAGDLCIPNPQDPNSFVCVIDASGEEGQAFDTCEYANACDPGLICANPALAAECDPMAGGCCLPFCDLSAWTCPGQDQTCLPWYEQGQAPPGYENVGVCGLPQ